MKKVLIVFLVNVVTFTYCNTDKGTTQRTRCGYNVFSNELALQPNACVVVLSLAASLATKDPKIGQPFFDLTLIQCLNYNYEMYKCEKKSNILPP